MGVFVGWIWKKTSRLCDGIGFLEFGDTMPEATTVDILSHSYEKNKVKSNSTLSKPLQKKSNHLAQSCPI